VRLVICLGMFLVFAGDYSALIASIFGNATEKNITDAIKEPETQLKGPVEKISVVSKTNVENNGKNKEYYVKDVRHDVTFFTNFKNKINGKIQSSFYNVKLYLFLKQHNDLIQAIIL